MEGEREKRKRCEFELCASCLYKSVKQNKKHTYSHTYTARVKSKPKSISAFLVNTKKTHRPEYIQRANVETLTQSLPCIHTCYTRHLNGLHYFIQKSKRERGRMALSKRKGRLCTAHKQKHIVSCENFHSLSHSLTH